MEEKKGTANDPKHTASSVKCENLVKTYRKRLTAVIANKGYITKY